MSEIKLKPCPFCGSVPRLWQDQIILLVILAVLTVVFFIEQDNNPECLVDAVENVRESFGVLIDSVMEYKALSRLYQCLLNIFGGARMKGGD